MRDTHQPPSIPTPAASVFAGDNLNRPVTKLSGLLCMGGMSVTKLAAATSDAEPVLLFQDARIVSHRKLDIAELGKLGFVPGSDWYPLDSETVFAQCYEEFVSLRNSSTSQ